MQPICWRNCIRKEYTLNHGQQIGFPSFLKRVCVCVCVSTCVCVYTHCVRQIVACVLPPCWESSNTDWERVTQWGLSQNIQLYIWLCTGRPSWKSDVHSSFSTYPKMIFALILDAISRGLSRCKNFEYLICWLITWILENSKKGRGRLYGIWTCMQCKQQKRICHFVSMSLCFSCILNSIGEGVV